VLQAEKHYRRLRTKDADDDEEEAALEVSPTHPAPEIEGDEERSATLGQRDRRRKDGLRGGRRGRHVFLDSHKTGLSSRRERDGLPPSLAVAGCIRQAVTNLKAQLTVIQRQAINKAPQCLSEEDILTAEMLEASLVYRVDRL